MRAEAVATRDACRLDEVRVERGGARILSIPSLVIAAGETTSVIGPSGAGKSTLLRLVAGLEAPTAGRVQTLGADGEPLVPGRVAMLFQRPVLLRGTVEENAAVGLMLRGDRNPMARVEPILERLGLASRRRRQIRTLSGGEQQRVALARTLVLRPELLLLDEPTSNLDPQNVALIESLLRDVQAEQGTTLLWVTHQPLQARRVAHSALLLLGGEVVEHLAVARFFSEDAAPRTRDFLEGRIVW